MPKLKPACRISQPGLYTEHRMEDTSFIRFSRCNLHSYIHLALQSVKEYCPDDDSGSTCLMACIGSNCISVSHLGDSYCFLLQKIMGEWQSRRINTLHSLNSKQERKRIEETLNGNVVQSNRGRYRLLNRQKQPGLNVSRVVGDVSYKGIGVDTTPEIIEQLMLDDRATDVVLIVASDFIDEKFTEDEITLMLTTHADTYLAHGVSETSLRDFNQSIVSKYHYSAKTYRDDTTLLSAQNPLDGSVVLNVNDGHAGDATSLYLQRQLQRLIEFAEKISLALPDEPDQKEQQKASGTNVATLIRQFFMQERDRQLASCMCTFFSARRDLKLRKVCARIDAFLSEIKKDHDVQSASSGLNIYRIMTQPVILSAQSLRPQMTSGFNLLQEMKAERRFLTCIKEYQQRKPCEHSKSLRFT